MIDFTISLICFFVGLFGIFYGALMLYGVHKRDVLLKKYYEQEAKEIIEELKLDMDTQKLIRITQIGSVFFGLSFLIFGAWLFSVSVVALGS